MSADKNPADHLLSDVNRLIHEPSRYNVLALLSVVERADFLFVQNQTKMTPGNLSAHVTKLEAAGYVQVDKRFVGKFPRTFLSLTPDGRSAFDQYRAGMLDSLNNLPNPGDQRKE